MSKPLGSFLPGGSVEVALMLGLGSIFVGIQGGNASVLNAALCVALSILSASFLISAAIVHTQRSR